MKTFSVILFLTSYFMIFTCNGQNKKQNELKLITPEDLGKDYINFINNGAKYKDFTKLLISKNDIQLVLEFIKYFGGG